MWLLSIAFLDICPDALLPGKGLNSLQPLGGLGGNIRNSEGTLGLGGLRRSWRIPSALTMESRWGATSVVTPVAGVGEDDGRARGVWIESS